MSEPHPHSAACAAAVLQVQGLHFAFPSPGAGRVPALFDDLNFALHPGVSLLHGDMGSGKTTLLRLLGGELAPQRGEIVLAGRRLGADPAADRRDICWFDPRDEQFDPLTAAGLFAALRQRHPGPTGGGALTGGAAAAGTDEWAAGCDADWQEHVEGFGLTPHLAKPLYALSTGSRRKAGLAAALACRCPLTLLDDPTAGLDRPALAWLAEVLEALAQAAAERAGRRRHRPDAASRAALPHACADKDSGRRTRSRLSHRSARPCAQRCSRSAGRHRSGRSAWPV
jgi:ABC-type multidrug transport system ATPase subunit